MLIKVRFLVLVGGAGSGKSVFAVQKILFRIITEQNHRILIIRKIASTLRDSTFKQVVDIINAWRLDGLANINRTDLTIKFSCFKSEIIFKGLDDPEKIKSITGITSIWI